MTWAVSDSQRLKSVIAFASAKHSRGGVCLLDNCQIDRRNAFKIASLQRALAIRETPPFRLESVVVSYSEVDSSPRLGFPAVPSPADRAPKPADEYFTGAYNTYRHGSAKGGPIDAIQLEMPLDVIGDKPENLQRVAGIVAAALAAYLERHYGWR
jgi:hypothetical protein